MLILNRISYSFLTSLLILLIGSSSCKKKPLSCECLEEGVFQSFTNDSSIINRTFFHQTEVNKHGDTTKLNILWMDSCRYMLKFKSSTNPKFEQLKTPLVIVEITDINLSDSVYHYVADINGKKMNGSVGMISFDPCSE